jgi:single-strand DNA-binding protein
MINKVTLVGHVGQDPEIRRLENGTPVGRFSLATNEVYKDATGELKDQTEWHNIVVWRNLAEQAEKVLKKGALVYVEGKISSRKYTDKNGIERTSVDIVAATFRNMTPKGSGGGNSNFPTQEPPMSTGRTTQNGSEPVFEVVAPTEPPPASDDLPF